MMTQQPYTIAGARLLGPDGMLQATHLRVENGRIAEIGDQSVLREGDLVIDGAAGTVLPGLIDAHTHLLPGCTQLAATFGVTTVLDMFSKPEMIDPERKAVLEAAAGEGPARADLRTSSIGATAPGGHPTMAYSPIPYVRGVADVAAFVDARVSEGASYIKIIYDDGSGAMLDLATLDRDTIEALLVVSHDHGLPVVAHVSTASGAVEVARCGVDVLAHAPFDDMSDDQVCEVADSGVAVIATLSVVDGFPDPAGVMPLLAQHELTSRLPARWRAVIEAQATRWMPPEPPDGVAQRDNVRALLRAGTRILAGTDAPNPGLVFGASLHRELQHLVTAGLSAQQAFAAATSVPAEVFGLEDRGVLRVGARADLILVDGDPTADIAATQGLRKVWVGGRLVDPDLYAGSDTEEEGITALWEINTKILAAIQELWPQFAPPT